MPRLRQVPRDEAPADVQRIDDMFDLAHGFLASPAEVRGFGEAKDVLEQRVRADGLRPGFGDVGHLQRVVVGAGGLLLELLEQLRRKLAVGRQGRGNGSYCRRSACHPTSRPAQVRL